MSNCFFEQIAVPEILLRVTNVCGVCFDDLIEGEIIYYDMQNYRYLCAKCHEKIVAKMNENCESIDENGLFE
jgi:hypothetical protein